MNITQFKNLIYIFILITTAKTFSACASINKTSIEEVKIALIGDTSAGSNFTEVLKLIEAEKAQVIMINGDFGYNYSPEQWKQKIISTIDTQTISVIGTLGNHDVERNNANKYISILFGFRNSNNNLINICTGSANISEGKDIAGADEVCTFKNVSIIGSGIGQILSTNYLENRLEQKLKEAPKENWKLIGYHFTLESMNPGIKGDQSTHKFFELIRKYGAIGAQGHTHSVMASCPISSEFVKGNKIHDCHPEFNNPNERFIFPGTGLYVDSSLGGKEVRNRNRCANPNEIGCHHMVDLISAEGYTRTDGITKTSFNRFGALFITFNKGSNPSKAEVYFKSIDGSVVFSFNITK